MNGKSVRLPGIVVLIGIVVFVSTALFSPILLDFFESDTLDEKIAVIEGSQTEWLITWLALGLGALIAGIGLWLFARALGSMTADSQTRSIAIAAGVLCFVVEAWYALDAAYNTLASPKSAAEDPPGFLFAIYVLGFLFGLAGFAYVLLRLKYRMWMAVVLIVAVALHLIQFAATGDIIPLSIYLFLLPIAIALIARPLAGMHTDATAPSGSDQNLPQPDSPTQPVREEKRSPTPGE